MPLTIHYRLRLQRLLMLIALMILAGFASSTATSAQDAIPSPGDDQAIPISNLLASSDSIFGVLVIDHHDQIAFEQNADVPFISASLYKLVLLAEMLDRVEAGTLSLDQPLTIRQDFFLIANGEDSYFSVDAVGIKVTLEELIYSTAAYSSNVGAQALFSLTSHARLDAFAKDLGLTQTRYGIPADQAAEFYRSPSDGTPSLAFLRSIAFIESFVRGGTVNLTTPRDMARFFRLLRDDQLVSPLVSWRIKQLLDARVINDRMPALLPPGTKVIHKTGNLDGVVHDAGIIETDAGPLIVITLAQAVTDAETTISIEQRVALHVYDLGTDSAVPVSRVLGYYA